MSHPGRAGSGHLIDRNDNGRFSVGCNFANAGIHSSYIVAPFRFGL